MNRVIEFRGQTDIKEWVFGDLVQQEKTQWKAILKKDSDLFEPIEVIKETVSEFIGYCANNDKKIYENDILWFTFFYYSQSEIEVKKLGIVKYIKGSFVFWVSEEEYYCFSELSFDSSMDIEIRGNVFDNPEMLLSDGSVK